jgi:hypothetical protein
MSALRFAGLLVSASAFYLPGVTPRDYADYEPVDVKVVRHTRTRT